MRSALKLLVLPTFFILPWLLMMLGDREAQVRQALASQPVLAGIVFLPGVVLFLVWIVNQLRK